MAVYPIDLYKAAVDTVVVDALPELTSIWQLDEAIRESWEERQFPFLVYELGEMEPADWGATRESYEWDTTFHYIARESPEDGGGIAFVEGQLERLREALRVSNQGVTGVGEFATLLTVALNTGREAEVNRIFYGKNVPFVGGSLRCRYEGGASFA